MAVWPAGVFHWNWQRASLLLLPANVNIIGRGHQLQLQALHSAYARKRVYNRRRLKLGQRAGDSTPKPGAITRFRTIVAAAIFSLAVSKAAAEVVPSPLVTAAAPVVAAWPAPATVPTGTGNKILLAIATPKSSQV
jgi:hypothetical protein